jgi:hypothetical protein
MAHGSFCSDGWRGNQRDLVCGAVLFSQPRLLAHSREVRLRGLPTRRAVPLRSTSPVTRSFIAAMDKVPRF